jgi:hypothetical protein
MRLFKRTPKRPKLEIEFGGPVIGSKSRVLLNGTDISRWVTGVELGGHVGDLATVTLHVLPDEVRARAQIVKYVTTGEDGVTREVML